MKILIFAAMALGLATPALAETQRIPATAATNKAVCPKTPVVAIEPGSTITGDDLPRTLSGYVTIDLKAGKVNVATARSGSAACECDRLAVRCTPSQR